MRLLPRPIDLLNRSVNVRGLRIARAIAYGEHPRQAMDIYSPIGQSSAPVIVFSYGGSWQTGARADYRFIATLLAAHGYVVAVPDYRIYPPTCFPGFVEDTTRAICFVREQIEHYGGSGEALFAMGHSAGAYNAVMAALAPDAPALCGVIGLAGPYDFLPLKDPVIKTIFSGPEDLRSTQPITHAHPAAAPMFLATGAADRTVLPRNTTAMAARLRHLGAVVETKIYPSLGHTGILLAMLPYLTWRAPVLRDVLGFCAACRAGDYATGSETAKDMVRRPL